MGLKWVGGAQLWKAATTANQGLSLVAIDGKRQGEGNGGGDRWCPECNWLEWPERGSIVIENEDVIGSNGRYG